MRLRHPISLGLGGGHPFEGGPLGFLQFLLSGLARRGDRATESILGVALGLRGEAFGLGAGRRHAALSFGLSCFGQSPCLGLGRLDALGGIGLGLRHLALGFIAGGLGGDLLPTLGLGPRLGGHAGSLGRLSRDPFGVGLRQPDALLSLTLGLGQLGIGFAPLGLGLTAQTLGLGGGCGDQRLGLVALTRQLGGGFFVARSGLGGEAFGFDLGSHKLFFGHPLGVSNLDRESHSLGGHLLGVALGLGLSGRDMRGGGLLGLLDDAVGLSLDLGQALLARGPLTLKFSPSLRALGGCGLGHSGCLSSSGFDLASRISLGGLQAALRGSFGGGLSLGQTTLCGGLDLRFGLGRQTGRLVLGGVDAACGFALSFGAGGLNALVGGPLSCLNAGGGHLALALNLAGYSISLSTGRRDTLFSGLFGGAQLVLGDLALAGFVGLESCRDLGTFAGGLVHEPRGFGARLRHALLRGGTGSGQLLGEGGGGGRRGVSGHRQFRLRLGCRSGRLALAEGESERRLGCGSRLSITLSRLGGLGLGLEDRLGLDLSSHRLSAQGCEARSEGLLDGRLNLTVG